MWTTWVRELLSGAEHDRAVPQRLRVADRYPNVPLRTQFDRAVRFRDAYINNSRSIIVNTMYTTCRDSCPGTSAALKGLRATLSPVFGKQLTFLSITLEPTVDNPARLLDYAHLYGADRESSDQCDWHFLTGAPGDIDLLRRSLGFFDLDPRIDRDVTQHASLLLCGNASRDRWAGVPVGVGKAELIRTIRRVAGITFEQRYGIRG